MARPSGGAALLRSRQLFSNGEPLGKWVASTRVVSLKHEHTELWQCVERVLGVATAEAIAFLQYFFSLNRMCVHDRMAETIVLDARHKAKP
jgi:hypothetical protein